MGLFKHKRFPHTDKINKYAVIIPVRNEEKVVANFINSIRASQYPQDHLTIFVVAHNCTDKTAEIARANGVVVYEINNDQERRKGYALRSFFNLLKKDYDLNAFDGYFIFDADNTVNPDYFQKMNDAYEYYHRERVIISFRDVPVFGENVLVDCYALMYGLANSLWARGRAFFDCTTRVFGCGYVFSSEIIKDGWSYVSITEDVEFSIDQVLKGRKVVFCNDAVFYDEQTRSFKTMLRQRLRWECGYIENFRRSAPTLIKKIFKKGTKNRGSVYDMLCITIPFCLVALLLPLLQGLFLLFSPLAGESLGMVFTNWPTISGVSPFVNFIANIFVSQNAGFLFFLLRNVLALYLGFIIFGIIIFIHGRKKYNHTNIFWKILLLLIWPLFMMLQGVLDFVAMFKRNPTWKPIPHYGNNGKK